MIKRKVPIFIVLVLVILCFKSISPAFAGVYNPSETETDEDKKTDMDKSYEADVSVGALLGESAEKADVEGLKQYIGDKSNAIVDLLQFVAENFLMIIFIIAAFITVIGALGDGSLFARGIIGMVACGAIYSIITFAPQALGYISGFFQP